MKQPFFLTPQIANLMEDFSREITRGSSLFFLYGDTGVGKSRLLDRLRKTRLQDKSVHLVDFAEQEQDSMSDEVMTLADKASAENIIIFDHFESAPFKAQQQIFDRWSTDGRDKKMNFIVCADSSSFSRFRQLVSQFQLEVKSFHLKPCNRTESEAFIQHLLYPEQPFSQLALNPSLKRLLRHSGGLFSSLEELARHHADSIRIMPKQRVRSVTGPAVIAVLLSGSLIAGTYFFYEYSSSLPFMNDPRAGMEPLDPESKKPIIQEPVVETVPEQVDEEENIYQDEPVPNRFAGNGISQDMNLSEKSGEGAPGEVTEPNLRWLTELLGSSREWIAANHAERGTIQIMSIAFDRFKVESFRDYLADLEQKGIDTDQLRLFETRAGGQAVYSLMYGEFADRREANRQIGQLPEVLRRASPIPRSAGSIAREIARFSSD